jgi:peptidoglycan/LPS O-acetylase OafA/YrhL
MLLAQLSLEPPTIMHAPNRAKLREAISAVLIPAGLFCCGFPEDHAEWSPWSRRMLGIGAKIFPWGVEQSRYWMTIGTTMILLGIIFSDRAKRFLSCRLLYWMGKQSFPVYLLHAVLIRSILTWLMFGFMDPLQRAGEDSNHRPYPPGPYPIAPVAARCFIIPLFVVILYYFAHLWNKYVETWCAWTMKRLEEIVFNGVKPAPQVSMA